MCSLVSPALLLLACQQMHQKSTLHSTLPIVSPSVTAITLAFVSDKSTGVSAFKSLRVLVTLWAYTCRNVRAGVLTTASVSTLFSVSRHGKIFTPARVPASVLTGASTRKRVRASAIVLGTTTDSLLGCMSTTALTST